MCRTVSPHEAKGKLNKGKARNDTPRIHGMDRMVQLGQYIPGESVVHRMDPRVKIIFIILLNIVILKGGTAAWLMNSAFLIVLLRLSGLPSRHLITALRPIRILLLLLFLAQLLFVGGEPIVLLSRWSVPVTREGLCQGVAVVWEFSLLVCLASILTGTSSPEELVRALETFLRPLSRIGVPSQDVAVMVSIALRFVPTFLEELERIKEAQMARGARFDAGGPIKRVRGAAGLFIPLLLSFVRRAENLALAMEARGYGRGHRTHLNDFRMSKTDYAVLLVITLITAFLFLERSSTLIKHLL